MQFDLRKLQKNVAKNTSLKRRPTRTGLNWSRDPDIDIVWIGTPPYLHSTIAISALEAGKHVFTQARMAQNLSEAEEMFAASQRNPHLVTMVCPPPHGMRGSLFMQKLLAEGLSRGAAPFASSESFRRIHRSGRSTSLETARRILGIERPDSQESMQKWFNDGSVLLPTFLPVRKRLIAIRQGYEIRIPDMVIVLCKFENGMEGVMEFSGVAPFENSDRLQVFGSQGMLDLRFQFGPNQLEGDLGEKSASDIVIPSELEQQLAGRGRLYRRRAIPGQHPTSTQFRAGPAVHAGCPGRCGFGRPGKRNGDCDLDAIPEEINHRFQILKKETSAILQESSDLLFQYLRNLTLGFWALAALQFHRGRDHNGVAHAMNDFLVRRHNRGQGSSETHFLAR